jgi:hypothetical protein
MQLKPITAIIVLLLVVAALLVSGCIQNAPQAQATATIAKPTATPKATAPPTLSSYMGMLVEHPASATTEDMTSKINKNNGEEYKIIDSFHRATIDGRDVYIGTMELDNGAHAKLYIFPLGSYDEARAAQSAYVDQFLSKGFTKVGDDTSNSAQDSYITLQNSQQVGCGSQKPMRGTAGRSSLETVDYTSQIVYLA